MTRENVSAEGELEVDRDRGEEKGELPGRNDDQDGLAASATTSAQEDTELVSSNIRRVLILLGLALSISLTQLDRNIVATAIPAITKEFDSFTDVGWYASAYLLTYSAFQLSWGKVYRILPVKIIFLLSVFIFELGSLVSAVSPTSTCVIVGRAISGFGSGGLTAGVFLIIALIVPLRWRPIINSLIGLLVGVTSASGPLLGGVFTTELTWRWCFYINLPLGGLTLLLIGLAYNVKENPEKAQTTWAGKTRAFDWIGMLLFTPSIVCLLLALQWAGTTYAWRNARIIALFLLFVLGFVLFAWSQWKQGERATIPARIMQKRSMVLVFLYTLSISAAFQQLQYFLPIWFQAIKGKSPLDSGIATLPLIICFVVSAVCIGAIISWWGQYVPFMLLGSALLAVAAGLISTFTPDTAQPRWIGYVALSGLGAGLAYEQPQIAAQVLTAGTKDVAIAVTTVTTFNTLGAAIALSVGNNILDNRLIVTLSNAVDGDVTPQDLLHSGITDLLASFAPRLRPAALKAYNLALSDVFHMTAALATLSFVAALGMKWGSVKKSKKDERDRPAGSESSTTSVAAGES